MNVELQTHIRKKCNNCGNPFLIEDCWNMPPSQHVNTLDKKGKISKRAFNNKQIKNHTHKLYSFCSECSVERKTDAHG